jgi:putative ABC transport system permease protein
VKSIGTARTFTSAKRTVGFRYDSRIVAIGPEFLDVFEVPLVAGRNFNSQLETDKKAMLISEEASRMFGFQSFSDALGKIVFIGSRRFEVIGVTRNYHYRTLQSKIEPVLYMQNYPRGPAYAVKVTPEQLAETIPQLKSIWENNYPGNVFGIISWMIFSTANTNLKFRSARW